MEDLKAEFETLYNDQTKNENDFQRFLEKNSQLIPRSFVQNHGIHLYLAFVKFPFGINYKSDFMFISNSSVERHVIHIEIEDPKKKFFTRTGDFTKEFNAAVQQVESWIAWLSNPDNQNAFNQAIDFLKQTFCFSFIPTIHKYVLVYGRRDELNTSVKASAISAKKKSGIFDIITYDSLFVTKHDNLHIAKLINQKIQITPCKDEELDFGLFDDLNTAEFSVPKADKERFISNINLGNYGFCRVVLDKNKLLQEINNLNTH